jgi:hypothetical protein
MKYLEAGDKRGGGRQFKKMLKSLPLDSMFACFSSPFCGFGKFCTKDILESTLATPRRNARDNTAILGPPPPLSRPNRAQGC